MNSKSILLIALAIFALPLAYAENYSTGGTLGVNITSTNQIAVYTSNLGSDSVMSFVPVSPPAAGNITLSTNQSTDMVGNETGYLVENQGNVNVSINVTSSLNATGFISGTGSIFKMWGVENKTNSCLDGNLVAYNSAFDLGTNGNMICTNLQYSDSMDRIWAYVTVTIPSDAPVTPGGRSATITFTSTQV